MPSLESLHQRFRGKKFVIIGVDIRESKETVLKAVRKNGLSFINLLDSDGKMSAMYGVSSTPVKMLIDKEGNMVGAALGYKLDNGKYPTNDQGLQALIELPSVGRLAKKWRKGGYLDKARVPMDPWESDFIYISPGLHGDFDLMSYGPDGEPGGEDLDADINNWEI